MPAVQTSYPQTLRPAVAGMKADMTPEVTISRVVEGVAGIGFGLAVGKGTGDRQVTLGGTGFIGVTLMDQTITHLTPQANPDFYPDKDVCVLMQKGTVWVLADGPVVAGDDVTFTQATGRIGTKAVAGDIIAIPNAVFETSAADGALAILKLK